MIQEQHMSPPAGPWEALWPIVGKAIESLAGAMTPATLGAMVMTILITHAVKVLAVVFTERVDEDLESWRAFCTAASILVGTLVGFAFVILGNATWAVVPICAFASGAVWRLLQALLPQKVADALITETDRRFRKEARDEV